MVIEPSSIRGAACLICYRAADEKDGDHFALAVTAGVWRITCPAHRVRLVGLEGYELITHAGAARFAREGTSIAIGVSSLTA